MTKEMIEAIKHVESEVSDLSRVVSDVETYMTDIENAVKSLNDLVLSEQEAEKDTEAVLLTEDSENTLTDGQEYVSFYVWNNSSTEQARFVVAGEFRNRIGEITKVDLTAHTNKNVAHDVRDSYRELSFKEARDIVLSSIAQKATNDAVGIETI